MKNNKFIVGVTGGIGSGKTYVCRLLNTMGYPVFYSDTVAKQLLVNNPLIINQIKDIFGKKAYLKNGELNRPYLAEQIFNDKSKLQLMNSIVHPAVRNEFQIWVKAQNCCLVFYESAIIFESGSKSHFDKTILVVAPKKIKIKRLLERDQTQKENIEKRMANQWTDEEKKALADYIIYNNDKDPLLPQIHKILKKLHQIANC